MTEEVLEKFEKKVANLKAKGMKDPDIEHLLSMFESQYGRIEQLYKKMAKRTRSDPQGEPQLKMKDLGAFVLEVEGLVQSELDTLKNFIIKHNVEHVPILSFDQFYTQVFKWVKNVYNDRQAHKSESPQLKNKSSKNPSSDRRQSTTNLGSLSKLPKITELTEEQKTVEYTVKLLEYKLGKQQLKIDKMLDRCMISPDHHVVDTKRHISDLIEHVIKTCNIFTCYSNDVRKQKKTQTDSYVTMRLAEYFKVVFRDEHGQSVFYKQQFVDGIIDFYKNQKPIQRDIGVNEVAIVGETDDEFTKHLEKGDDGRSSIITQPHEEEDPLSTMKAQLLKTKSQYEKLLSSDKISDPTRRATLKQMLKGIDKQLDGLQQIEKNEALQHEDERRYAQLKQQSIDSIPTDQLNTSNFGSLKSSIVSPKKGRRLKPGISSKQDTLMTLGGQSLHKPSVEEYRKMCLKEIFRFYSRQHIKQNMGFGEFEEQIRKIDMGEFNSFCRDFDILLPRHRVQEIFKKAGDNNPNLQFNQFEHACLDLSSELAEAKLRENKMRLQEMNFVAEKLEIPESYPNRGYTQKYHDRVLEILNKKTENYVKYVENNLKQAFYLSYQVEPLGLAKQGGRKKFKGKRREEDSLGSSAKRKRSKDNELGKVVTFVEEEAKNPPEPPGTTPVDPGKAPSTPSKKQKFVVPKMTKLSFLQKTDLLDKLDLEPRDDEYNFEHAQMLIEKQYPESQLTDEEDEVLSENKDDEENKEGEEKLSAIQENNQEETLLNQSTEKDPDAGAPPGGSPIKSEEYEGGSNDYELPIDPPDLTDPTADKTQDVPGTDNPTTSGVISKAMKSGRTSAADSYDIHSQVNKFPEFIFHPFFQKIREIERQIDRLEKVKTDKDVASYFYDDVVQTYRHQYRKKIKGFHLAFNVRDKKAEDLSSYKYHTDVKAEELRLNALERKNQRLNNQKMRDLMNKQRFQKDRDLIRKMHEDLRVKKQKQLKKMTMDLSSGDPSNYYDITSLVNDRNKYKMLKKKQDEMGRNKELDYYQRNRDAIAERKKRALIELEQSKQEEIESMIMNRKVTFDEIDKLNYQQINQVSNQYGDDTFNPHDILDFKDDDASDISDNEEILKKFNKPTHNSKVRSQFSNYGNNDDPTNMATSNGQAPILPHPKPSSLWDIKDPSLLNIQPPTTTKKKQPSKRSSKVLQQATASGIKPVLHQSFGNPLYSPMQHHNPKRKGNHATIDQAGGRNHRHPSGSMLPKIQQQPGYSGYQQPAMPLSSSRKSQPPKMKLNYGDDNLPAIQQKRFTGLQPGVGIGGTIPTTNSNRGGEDFNSYPDEQSFRGDLSQHHGFDGKSNNGPKYMKNLKLKNLNPSYQNNGQTMGDRRGVGNYKNSLISPTSQQPPNSGFQLTPNNHYMDNSGYGANQDGKSRRFHERNYSLPPNDGGISKQQTATFELNKKSIRSQQRNAANKYYTNS